MQRLAFLSFLLILICHGLRTQSKEAPNKAAALKKGAPPKKAAVPKVCTLPVVKGTCHAKLKRWFYNPKTRQCETFIYRGCNGNHNNFLKKQECQKICKVI